MSPDHKDLSKQVQWFDDNAIKPAETLLKALTTGRHLLRTSMAPELDQRLGIEQLVPMLEAYLYRADDVRIEMEQQAAHGIYNKDQLQYEVVRELFDIFQRAFGEAFTRKGSARRIESALRIGCAEVLGEHEQINSIVRTVRTERTVSLRWAPPCRLGDVVDAALFEASLRAQVAAQHGTDDGYHRA